MDTYISTTYKAFLLSLGCLNISGIGDVAKNMLAMPNVANLR